MLDGRNMNSHSDWSSSGEPVPAHEQLARYDNEEHPEPTHVNSTVLDELSSNYTFAFYGSVCVREQCLHVCLVVALSFGRARRALAILVRDKRSMDQSSRFSKS